MMHVLLSSGTEAVNMAKVVTDGLTSVTGEMTSILSTVVPIALGIVGSVIAVKFGINFFRSLVKKG